MRRLLHIGRIYANRGFVIIIIVIIISPLYLHKL